MSAEQINDRPIEIRAMVYRNESGGGVIDRYVRWTGDPKGIETWMGSAVVGSEMSPILDALGGATMLPLESDSQQSTRNKTFN